MTPLTKGQYTVAPVIGPDDREAVFALRGLCFGPAGAVADAYDATAQHVMVRRDGNGPVVAAFRMSLHTGPQLEHSYAGAVYDLRALAVFHGPLLELGRFCIHPAHPDPDILRIAWAALTAYVDEMDVRLMFGCASFAGTDPAPYKDAFALLKARHLAPQMWRPDVKAADVYRYSDLVGSTADVRRANAVMPPLLRTYLVMGGWVSDHAVIDHEMKTLHVFTGLEIGAIPDARKRLLRALV